MQTLGRKCASRERRHTFSVVTRAGGRPSIPEAAVMDREAAAYWIPAFAGMTTVCKRCDLHVIASEAKQSILSLCSDVDCFASLAMTWKARIAPDTPVGVGYDDLFATRKILENGSVLGASPMPVTPM